MCNWFKRLFGCKKDCCCHKGESCCHGEKDKKEEASATPAATPGTGSGTQTASTDETPKTE